MEKTIELISGRVAEIENCIIKNFEIINNNFEDHKQAINKLYKAVCKQSRFNKLVLIAGIYGAYTLRKQNKELQELKAKNEEQAEEK